MKEEGVVEQQTQDQASANLDRIAAEHPELLGQSTPDEWEGILKDQVTAKPKSKSPQGLRLPDELLNRVDRYAARLESELHITVSRSDAIRRMITIGLEDEEDIRDATAVLEEEGGIPLSAVKAEYG